MTNDEPDIDRFLVELIAAYGEDGIAENELMKAVSVFGNMLSTSAVIDLWRKGLIRAVGYYDDDLIWAAAEEK